MRQARALHLPNEALYVEEIKFWLQDLQEHAMFIRRGLRPESADFSDAAQEFQRAFSIVLQKTEKLKSIKQMKGVIGEAREIVQEFQKFQRKILSDLLCGRGQGFIFPFFIDHMVREAQYFLELLQKLECEKEFKTVSHTRELVIWLRFLADHIKLADHSIDPSERRISKIAGDFNELFERLGWEARDWASMLYGHKESVCAFERFIMDVRVDVQRLRDFFKMMEDLIADCRLLGIITVELAAHMRREAEHCLLMLTCLEKGAFKHDMMSFQDDIDGAVWQDNERLESAAENDADSDGEDLSCGTLPEDEDTYRESVLPELEKDELLPEICSEADSESGITGQSADRQIEAPIWIMPEEQLRSQAVVPQVQVQPETLYMKAGEHHHRPSHISGTAPAERYGKSKRNSPLPRPLGKVKQ